jgi:hypothetical protein
MSDEIKVVGQVDIVKVVSTLDYVVKEMERIGDVVEEQGKEAIKTREELRLEIAGLRDYMKDEIACLDKAQTLTDRELKWFVAKVSTVAATAVSAALWILKSGVLAALL